jgi:hypothetical protein
MVKFMTIIKLTRNKSTIIDNEDFDLVNQYKWFGYKDHNKEKWYVLGYKKGERKKYIYMHRLILSAPKGILVDHRDRDGLNNQKSNLRLCNHSQNLQNQKKRSSLKKHKGVYWCKNVNKWNAQIGINSKSYSLGYFDNEIEAARAYNNKAKELFGEFARLNYVH